MTRQLNNEALVEAKDLKVLRGGRTVIEGLDLDLPESGIVGIVGPNGAGKTTLMEVMAGRLAYAEGTVRIAGRSVIEEIMWVRRHVSVASIPAGAALRLPGIDYLRLVAGAEGYNALTERQVRLAKILGLGEVLRQPISTYSHGTRKKLSLVASLNDNALVYIYDEIFNGLDIVSMRAMRAFFADLAGDGKLVIICSHFLQLLFGWCDEVVLLAGGRVARRWQGAALKAFPNYETFEEEAIGYHGA